MRAFRTSFMSGQTRMREDRAVAERARAPFHPALKPSHDAALGDVRGDAFQETTALQPRIGQTGGLQIRLNLLVGELRTEIRVP